MSKMEQILEQAKDVKPIGEADGVKVVNYEDAATLASKKLLEQQLGEDVDLGDVEINPDGTIAKTRVSFLAMNEDRRLMNRYRVTGKQGGGKLLQVVTDERAVREHDSGKVPQARVPAFEFERGKEGKLELTRLITVTSDDFIAKFNDELSNEAMYEVLEAISRNEEDSSRTELPI